MLTSTALVFELARNNKCYVISIYRKNSGENLALIGHIKNVACLKRNRQCLLESCPVFV